ncbi:MAG: hypothetical protein HUU49_03905 [Candidatus Buchananbacteria bacterium]|nr:hypothetical protein [Candidatus Buchananbacteria bacterium]
MFRSIGALLLLIHFLVGPAAAAVGVAVKPVQLTLQGTTMRAAAGEFLVANVDQVPALYQVSADQFGDIISFDSADFQLQPQETRIVKFKAWFVSPGTFQTNISVAAKPLGNSGLAAASGVKVPLTITVGGISLMALIGLIMVFCLVLAILLMIRLKKKK